MGGSLIMDYRKEINTIYIYPNLTIYNCYAENELYGYELTADDGYIMYNTAAKEIIVDPDTQEEVESIYYCKKAAFPLDKDLSNLTWVAVEEEKVD